jgi:hypothetical protein
MTKLIKSGNPLVIQEFITQELRQAFKVELLEEVEIVSRRLLHIK